MAAVCGTGNKLIVCQIADNQVCILKSEDTAGMDSIVRYRTGGGKIDIPVRLDDTHFFVFFIFLNRIFPDKQFTVTSVYQ
ncbi:hypothetical protein [Bacteroides sp. OM08-11]|uniref:hypothetical protein n=1 Tax=Bacteroides sp. OM08-11 TaxID=2292284 RepID=UPI003519FE58